jgi:hypothetical protein
MSADRLELTSYDRVGENPLVLVLRNGSQRTLDAGLLRVELTATTGHIQRLTAANAWPIDALQEAKMLVPFATMISSFRAFGIVKADVVDYRQFDGRIIPCGAVVKFEGLMQAPVIRHVTP